MEQIRKKRICFLIDKFIFGGVEKVVIDTIKQLRNDYNITLYIATQDIDQNLKAEVENYADVVIGHMHINEKTFALLSIPLIAKFILEKNIKDKYDCVIVCKPALSNIVFTHMSKKYIYWNHGDKDVMYATDHLSIPRRINKIRLSYIYKKYDLVLSVVPEIANLISKAFNLSHSEALTNPCDLNLVTKKSKEPVSDFSKTDKLTICCVGRLSVEKRFDRVIRAVSKLDQSKYQVLILGDGPERHQLENLIKLNNLENNVYLLGNKANPYPYIKQSDLLVSSSERESYGLTILEAMILKTPVIATNTTGARFLLKEGKLGYIVQNDKCFLTILQKLVYDREMLNAHVNEAFEYAAHFNLANYKKKISKYIDEVIEL